MNQATGVLKALKLTNNTRYLITLGTSAIKRHLCPLPMCFVTNILTYFGSIELDCYCMIWSRVKF